MDDFHFRERSSISTTNIPERVVHARGYGAPAIRNLIRWPLYKPTSSSAGEKTPAFVRFHRCRQQGFC
jgi:catalase